MSPKKQIKPCPFCGCQSKRTIFIDSLEMTPRKVWTCQCSNPMCPGNSITYGPTRRIAIERWDRRTQFPNFVLDGWKGCPFCGATVSNATVEHHPIDLPDIDKPFVSIWCPNEQCESRPLVTADNETELQKKWNTRYED
jgi:hypothetical protein